MEKEIVGTVKKIDRGKLLGVVFQKCTPSLRGRLVMSDRALSNSCLRDIDSEFEPFAMNSKSSPERIGFAYGSDEFTNLSGNSWPPQLTALEVLSPKQAETLAMPGEDHFRFKMMRAERHCSQRRESQIQSNRSRVRGLGRLETERFKTII
jgi:hypothetical protein